MAISITRLLIKNYTHVIKNVNSLLYENQRKNVEMQDAVITKTSRGGYMAQGNDGKGNKMTTMLSEANALEAVKNGVAKKSW